MNSKIYIHLMHMRDILLELSQSADDDLSVTKNKRNIERCLEILGEAARRIPKDYQINQKQIPWADIIGTRNVITHDYEKISPVILQQIVKHHALSLIPAINTLINQFETGL
jgi:uncharacterized protein with HEPN domain